jgi:hypothetical protein
MRAAAALLAVAAVCIAGCGKSAPPPAWSEVASPASAAPMLGSTSGAPVDEDAEYAQLEAAIARAQGRVTQAPEIIALMNPMGGQVDIPEAHRRTSAALAACRADHATVSAICERLADAHPDAAKTPTRVVLRQMRGAAYRYREWALIQLLTATDAMAADLLKRSSSPSTPELLIAASQLDGLTYGHEGEIMYRRYLALAGEALSRVAKPEENVAEVALHLADMRMMAYAWSPAQWSASDGPELDRQIAAFKQRAAALPGPAGAALSRYVALWWDKELISTGANPPAEKNAAAAAEMRALAAVLPAAAQGLREYAVSTERAP